MGNFNLVDEKALHNDNFVNGSYIRLEVKATKLYNFILEAEENGYIYLNKNFIEGKELKKVLKKYKFKFLTLFECFKFEKFGEYNLTDPGKIAAWAKEINFYEE